MIEIAAYFSNNDLDKVLGSLLRLPEVIRPVYYNDSENLANPKDLISDKKRFEKFIVSNPEGFFLSGSVGLYDLKISSNAPSHMYIDLPDEYREFIEPFFEVIAQFKPHFAYAADSNERKHRNRCCKTIGANHIEDWVGRDISKYAPGLYCYTLISRVLIKKLDIDLGVLSSSALSMTDLGGNEQLYLFRFYDDTKMWKSEAQRLDELCYQAKGIFSMRDVLNATKEIDNILDYDDIIFDWR